MALSGFLKGLGQQAGYGITYDKAAQADQVTVDLRRQQLEANRLAIDTQKQQAADRLAAMSELKSGLSEAKTTKEQVSTLRKGQLSALATGDFQTAGAMSSMIKEAESEDDRAQASLMAAAESKHEATAKAASDYAATKSPEAARALVEDYKAAGGDVLQVPPPGPKFDAWAEQQQFQGKEGMERAKFAANLLEKKAEQARIKADSDRNFAASRADHRDTVANQNRSYSLQKAEFEFKKAQKAALSGDPTEQDTIDRLARAELSGEEPRKNVTKDITLAIEKRKTELIASGAKQENFAQGVNPKMYSQQTTLAGQTLLAELRNVAGMPLGQTAGAFADLGKGEGITSSLVRQFGNKVTSTEAANYNASMVPLGVDLATLASGGRKPQAGLIEEFHRMVRAESGDSIETTMYKQTLAVNLARAVLAVTPPANAADKKSKDELKAQMQKYPTPKQFLAQVEKSGHSVKGYKALNAQMQGLAESFQLSGEGSAATPVKAAPTTLPAGWK